MFKLLMIHLFTIAIEEYTSFEGFTPLKNMTLKSSNIKGFLRMLQCVMSKSIVVKAY